MKNIYEPQPAKIISTNEESSDVISYKLELLNPEQQKKFYFFPGQFLMISISGFGEAPVGIASSSWDTDTFEICVRKAGRLTSALHKKKVGDVIGIRGPLGKGYFPMKSLKDRNLLLIAGGIGIVPLRAVILDIIKKPELVKKAQLFYGAKCENQMIYKQELSDWKKSLEVDLTVDKHSDNKCNIVCDEGLITKLFETEKIVDKPVVFIVGPPVMCKFVIDALHKAGAKDEDIYISLERHMECGVGECHHCGVGSRLVCDDGPVFKYFEISNIPGAV